MGSHLIVAVDPGVTTGLVIGTWPDSSVLGVGGVALSWEERVAGGVWSSFELVCGEVATARAIAEVWMEARREERAGLSCSLVMEDFVVRPGPAGAGRKREFLAPVRVAALAEGMLIGAADEYRRGGWGPSEVAGISWYSAGEGLRFAHDLRLREWGCWVRGSDHARSAMRLALLHLRRERAPLRRELGGLEGQIAWGRGTGPGEGAEAAGGRVRRLHGAVPGVGGGEGG